MGKSHLFSAAAIAISALILAACASMGTPSGGARDETPPRFVRANPPMGAVGVNRNTRRLTLDFDEIITVKDAFQKVVVSPVGAAVPRVSSNGRRIYVEFEDSLMANTTYTVDFADAIADNNEGNPLNGFFYTFSTGARIDSLEISGMVLGALDLEPKQGVLVGVYPDSGELSDSAFFRHPFERLARTDEKGRFTVPGLSPIPYRLYALNDLDADKKFANPEEDIAFLPHPITPSAERIETVDTILNLLNGSIDTIVSRMRTRFLPNDILLRMFNTGIRPQYLAKYERRDSTAIMFQFNAPSDRLPEIRIAGKTPNLILERSATNDTLTYWLPRNLATLDSLEVEASFLRPDSTGSLVWGTDLLEFNFKRPKAVPQKKKKKKEDQEDEQPKIIVPELSVSLSNAGTQEVYRPLNLTFPVPLARLDTAAFILEEKVDTLWKPVKNPYRIVAADTLNPRRFQLDYPWEFAKSYRLSADSASAEGLYGQVMKSLSSEFKTKSREDYSSLIFTLSGISPQESLFVELLGSSGDPVRRAKVVGSKAEFFYLDPGTYYARLVEDFDGDGLFTTGFLPDPADSDTPPRLPEAAYYYPKKINIKQNWDIDQDWNPFETPVDTQKPASILKNKPKDRRGNQQNQQTEEEDEVFDPTVNPFDPKDAKRKKAAREGTNPRF